MPVDFQPHMINDPNTCVGGYTLNFSDRACLNGVCVCMRVLCNIVREHILVAKVFVFSK